MRRPSLGRVIAVITALLVPTSLSLVPAVTVQASASTYYVDCAGSDYNSGTSTTSPWRSISKANSAPLSAGGSLLFKRGCTWTGPLTAKWNGTSSAPITIGAYGSGSQPKIQNAHEDVAIYGSYQVIDNISTRADPTGYDGGCQNNPTGWRAGFRFFNGSHDNTVRYSTATGLYFGILADGGSHNNKILHDSLVNNNMKDPNPSSDAGGVAIGLMGDYNEVAWNTISGSDICSELWGRDGSAVEVYGGRNNSIHDNVASQNNNFTELGNSRSAYNTYAYNQVYSSLDKANFLVTRGPNSGYGPVYYTKVYNSSVYLSGAHSYAIQCTAGCSSSVLSFHNNIVWANGTVGYADHSFDEARNIYWSASAAPKVWFTMSSTSKKTNPKYVSLSPVDLRLQSTSPAINVGDWSAPNLGYKTDLDGVYVPQGSAPDEGGHEYH